MAAIRVAAVACIAIVGIAWFTIVVIVDLSLVIMRVAIKAVEDLETTGHCMAFRADIPFVVVLAAIYREVLGIMIEARGVPCGGGMTHRTVGRIPLLSVVRIRCAIVVRHVARVTIGWGSCVPARMALVAARIHVLACQREARAVVVEGRRGPCGGLMALGAIRRETKLGVVWSCR